MNRSYSDVYQGFIWWVEDMIDWIDILVDKYTYRGAHRGEYDWNIGRSLLGEGLAEGLADQIRRQPAPLHAGGDVLDTSGRRAALRRAASQAR